MASEAITQALAGGDKPSLAPAIAALNSPDDAGWRDLFDSLELIKDGAHELFLNSEGRWVFQPKRATPPRPPAKKAAPHRATA